MDFSQWLRNFKYISSLSYTVGFTLDPLISYRGNYVMNASFWKKRRKHQWEVFKRHLHFQDLELKKQNEKRCYSLIIRSFTEVSYALLCTLGKL